jgi:hypothetical protein
MDDPTRRDMLATGAVATALAATPSLFAQQTGQGGTGARRRTSTINRSQARLAFLSRQGCDPSGRSSMISMEEF